MSLNTITVKNPGDKPYLVTGHKMYLIGSQDGLFPQRGEHLPFEMWGIWAPPVKVMNGFWFLIDGELVKDASSFDMLPYGAKQTFQKNAEWELLRFQFVPQEETGFVLCAELTNKSSEEKEFRLNLGIESNLMPVWLAERAGIADGVDSITFEAQKQRLMMEDSENPWTAVMGCSCRMEAVEDAVIPVTRRENGKTRYAEVESRLRLKPNETAKVTYWFAFSPESGREAEETLKRISANEEAFLSEKEAVYTRLDRTAALTLPGEPVLEEMYRWTKYINDWIIRDVKHVGRGVVAGYAEFPWWFGNDTNYIAPALLMQGEYDVCKDTLRIVQKKSEEVNGDGRIVHEISSNGIVYYEGMTTETPQFADTVWMIYQWSGDRAFLEEMYDTCVRGMNWIESKCVDGLPAGYGISEIAGLDCFCCDTALLAIRGYEILSLMSGELGNEEEAKEYRKKQEKTWEIFQKEFYLPEYGIYGDMVADKEDIIPRADTWKYTLNSFPISKEEKIMGESSCKNDKTPEDLREKEKLKARMERVIEEAEQMEDHTRKAFYLFGFGHSAVTLEFDYLHGAEAEKLYEAQKRMNELEHVKVDGVMPIGIAREIIGLGNLGRCGSILEQLHIIAEGFSKVMPGATNEIYPEKGCFVQAWNSLATMWPYANSIFGIRPDANHKKVTLKPCISKEISGIALEHIKIGGEDFTFRYQDEDGNDVVYVKRPSDEWGVTLADTAADIKLRLEA